ncbi:hypothetical protein DPMN_164045 [Dreissena polymorpha]|uniref:Uncharacterized protein n=1 Tax=Dreissena polymorpha TaxID=45954 RepID=A0A9D4ES87_DREPO|nr:hypothetical protein DPMN_164045 [Dreissena polymorpha]
MGSMKTDGKEWLAMKPATRNHTDKTAPWTVTVISAITSMDPALCLFNAMMGLGWITVSVNRLPGVGNSTDAQFDDPNYYSFKTVVPGIKIHDLWDNIHEKRDSIFFDDEFKYVYLHEALAEGLLIGTHHVTTGEFERVHNYMMGRNNDATATRLEHQFELLRRSVQHHPVEIQKVSSQEAEYGNIETVGTEQNGTVSVIKKSLHNGFVEVTYSMKKNAHESGFDKTIRHFVLTSWKGDDTQTERTSLLKKIEAVHTLQPEMKDDTPIVILDKNAVSWLF